MALGVLGEVCVYACVALRGRLAKERYRGSGLIMMANGSRRLLAYTLSVLFFTC